MSQKVRGTDPCTPLCMSARFNPVFRCAGTQCLRSTMAETDDQPSSESISELLDLLAPRYELTGTDARRYTELAHYTLVGFMGVAISLGLQGVGDKIPGLLPYFASAMPKSLMFGFNPNPHKTTITEKC